ncbi:hypothetical protein Lser_V15G08740 [Lactuca serriola]
MVTKPGSTTNSLWLDIEALFRDNKEAHTMELENKLRKMSMGDRSVNEFYKKMKVTADLLGNIGNFAPEHTLLMYFLNGLNLKYDHLVVLIRYKDPLPNLLQAQSILTLEESRLSRTRQAITHHSDHASAPTVIYLGHPSPPQNCNNNNRNNTCSNHNRNGSHRNGSSHRQPSTENRQLSS